MAINIIITNSAEAIFFIMPQVAFTPEDRLVETSKLSRLSNTPVSPLAMESNTRRSGHKSHSKLVVLLFSHDGAFWLVLLLVQSPPSLLHTPLTQFAPAVHGAPLTPLPGMPLELLVTSIFRGEISPLPK